MATGGIEDRIQEGLMTDEEAVNLKEMFNEMGARPKARTIEELQHWLLDYAASLKSEPQRTRSPQHLKSSLFLDGNHGLSSLLLTMAMRVMICGGTKFTVSSKKSIWRKIYLMRSDHHCMGRQAAL